MRLSVAPPRGTQGARAVEARAAARPMSVWAGLATTSASSSPAAAAAAVAGDFRASLSAATVATAAELVGKGKTVGTAEEGLGVLPGPAAMQVWGAITLWALRAPLEVPVELGNLAVTVGSPAAAAAVVATYKAAAVVAAALETRAAVATTRAVAEAAVAAQAGLVA